MKSNTIVSGIWLIFIGLIVLLHNFDIIDFNFWAVTKLIPLLIIALGINLIVQNKSYGTYIIVGVNVIICAIFLIKGITTPINNNSSRDLFSKTKRINSSKGSSNLVENAKVAYENDKQARLILNGGGGNYKLENKNTNNLFEALSSNAMNLELKTTETESKGRLLEINSSGTNQRSNKKNEFLFTLHQIPIWDLEFNIGAADFVCDLSPYKLQNVEINSGALSMNMTLGMPQNGITKIEIATAASSIKLNIPKDAACSFTQESILSSKSIAGFDVKDGDTHKTSNFDQAENKYVIDVTGAANSFTLARY